MITADVIFERECAKRKAKQPTIFGDNAAYTAALLAIVELRQDNVRSVAFPLSIVPSFHRCILGRDSLDVAAMVATIETKEDYASAVSMLHGSKLVGAKRGRPRGTTKTYATAIEQRADIREARTDETEKRSANVAKYAAIWAEYANEYRETDNGDNGKHPNKGLTE